MNLTPKQTIKGTVAEAQSLKGTMKDIPSVDNTLTKEGYAADAKAVGEALKTKAPISHTEDKDNPHGVTASQVGARPDTWMPSASEIGARPDNWMPTAQEIGARPNTWMPTANDVGARPNTWMPTASEVGALPTSGGTVTGDILVRNDLSKGYVQIINDWEGGTIRLGSKDGTYCYELDANSNHGLRLHTHTNHPSNVEGREWGFNAESGVIWGVGTPTSENDAANKKYVDSAVKNRNVYYAFGNLIKSNGGTVTGTGIATVFIEPSGLARIDFSITITASGTVNEVFQYGIASDILREINPSIPVITPIGGGVLHWYRYPEMTFNDTSAIYGALPREDESGNYWRIARIYSADGTWGDYPETCLQVNQRIIGTCYGNVV